MNGLAGLGALAQMTPKGPKGGLGGYDDEEENESPEEKLAELKMAADTGDQAEAKGFFGSEPEAPPADGAAVDLKASGITADQLEELLKALGVGGSNAVG